MLKHTPDCINFLAASLASNFDLSEDKDFEACDEINDWPAFFEISFELIILEFVAPLCNESGVVWVDSDDFLS